MASGGGVVVDKAIQVTDQGGRRDGSTYLDSQAFSVGFVDDDVECPEPSTAVQGVVHQVQCPAAIGFCREVQWLTWPFGQTLLGTSG